MFYRDNLNNTDVRFVSSTSTGSINYQSHASMLISGVGDAIYSTANYTQGIYRYEFSLLTSTGSVTADAESA